LLYLVGCVHRRFMMFTRLSQCRSYFLPPPPKVKYSISYRALVAGGEVS